MSKRWVAAILFLAFLATPTVTVADSLTIVPSSPLTGAPICKPGFVAPQCTAVPFDTSGDLAFSGNGFAQPAVAKDSFSNVFPDHASIHQPQFANDGFYGNGSSWIGTSFNSWIKIDLGQTIPIDTVWFGRDRTGGFDDRDPGQFKIALALFDDVYANGNDNNDINEYTIVFDSAAFGFSGFIIGSQTLQAAFTPQNARFVKLTFASPGPPLTTRPPLTKFKSLHRFLSQAHCFFWAPGCWAWLGTEERSYSERRKESDPRPTASRGRP